MNYSKMTGRDLLQRRMSGRCLECGTRPPMSDDSGFGGDLCFECHEVEKRERRDEARKQREATAS